MNGIGSIFILRNPSFLKLWTGQVLSQSCGRMFQITLVWWILQNYKDSSGKLIGAFMVMAALPALILAKKIGERIDRGVSRQILIQSDLLAFVTLLVVAGFLFQGYMNVPLLLVFALLMSSFQAFIDPTLNKAVAEVVQKNDVEEGVGFLSATQSIASFSGAILGAALIDRLGIPGTILLSSSGYLLSSIATYFAEFQPLKADDSQANQDPAAGWAILRDQPLLKAILMGFALVNFFATPTLVVLPVYVSRVLQADAQTLGLLEAGLWVGLILGAMSAKYVNFGSNRLLLGAVCLLVFGICLAVPGIVTSYPLYAGALIIAGAALGINNAKFMAFFQEMVPAALKGRFFALMQALLGSSFPIAYFLFGSLTDIIAPGTVCLIQGAGVVLLSGYFFRLAGKNE
jgi:predicted MFS family arabinose efflux permease